ncbi:hypothetical protein WA158_002697 [Blastocystis sp. Blastoise]
MKSIFLVYAALFIALACASGELSFTVTSDETTITVNALYTANGTVWCNALLPSAAVPSSDSLMESIFTDSISSNVAKNIVIRELTSLTEYTVYCFGEDEAEDPMTNTIASIKKTISTTGEEKGSLTVSYTSSNNQINALVSFTVDGTIYCLAVSKDSETPSISTMKESTYKQAVTSGSQYSIFIKELTPATTYDAYCYAESTTGVAMKQSISDIKQTITTAEAAPELTVIKGTLSDHSLTLNLTLSTNGYVWCGLYEFGAKTPSDTDIQKYSYIHVSAHTSTLLTVFGLQSDYTYDSYCYAENDESIAMSTEIKNTKIELKTLALQCSTSCGFGRCNTITNKCECSPGFTFDPQGSCTVEENTIVFLVQIKGEADFSTTEKKAAYLKQFSEELAAAVSLPVSRVLADEAVASPILIAARIIPGTEGDSALASIRAIMRMYSIPSSALFAGNITKDIDTSFTIPFASVKEPLPSVSSIPTYATTTVNSDSMTQTVSLSVSDADLYIDQIEIGYSNSPITSVNVPMHISSGSSATATIAMDTTTLPMGVTPAYVRFMSDYTQASHYYPITLLKANSTNSCSALDGKTGMDLLIGYTTLPFFYPGVITGVCIIAVFSLFCICCCCCKKQAKAKPAVKNGFKMDKKIQKPVVEKSIRNVKKSRV